MEKIKIKPISVNTVWKGKRYKTKAYQIYEAKLMFLLKPVKVPEGELSLFMNVGFSSKNADLDNVLKPFIDILQKKHGFNDKQIFRIDITKTLVNKGNEYIEYSIEKFITENK